MEIYNIPQLSDEWWEIKKKKLSAGHAQAIGSCGKGLVTYVNEIMAEYYSNAEKKSFSNYHTERGIELEDSAGMVYSFEKNIDIKKVGFVVYNEFVGCSPDLFCGDDGLAEIKCPDDKGFFGLLLGEEPDSKYVWQCQMQLLICEKAWCDLVYYNPNYSKSLIVKRILPDKEKFSKLLAGFEMGIKLIKEIESKIGKAE